MSDHILLQLAIALAAAKIGGEICERWLKQPAVLGEIVLGVVVGGSVLGWIHPENATLTQLAEIGAILLLFEVGLESDIEDLFKVGAIALWVASMGVIFTFILALMATRFLRMEPIPAVFVSAAMTATSVGITARVFSDLKALHTKEARTVLGAAVADDVMGLIIVAAVTGIAITKSVSVMAIAKMTGMAVLFLAGAIVIGLRATPFLLHRARKMQARAAVPVVAVIFCLLLATIADLVQLAPIVGAFAAGLVLAKTEHKVHFEEKIKSLADVFVPVFFVMMGARMTLHAFNPATTAGRATLAIGLLLLVAVVVGKVLAGLSIPSRGFKRWTVGLGMIPRGEVTLIAASIGLGARAITPELYAAIVFVVVCTTFVTPLLLKMAAGPPKTLHRGPSDNDHKLQWRSADPPDSRLMAALP